MKMRLILILLLLIACQNKKESADLILLNGQIYTVDNGFSEAQAFAVRDGKFLAVGPSEMIKSAYQTDHVIDAGGKTVLPGLIDAHCHFYELGLGQQLVNLTGTVSFEEVLERIDTYYQEYQPQILRGRGWDQNDWEIANYPTREELDERYPDIPVVLERVDGHAFLVNSKALQLAGIDKNTHVEGGEIVKLKNGDPSGILIDAPMNLVTTSLPEPELNAKIRALKDAERICFQHGLTTVNDAGLDRDIIGLIDSLQQVGELSIRVYAMISNKKENLDHYLPDRIIDKDLLQVRSVKVYADGALGSRGAVLKKPYSDQSGHYGAMVTPVEDIETLAAKLADSEFQMNTHAIGDSANAVVLRAYKSALEGRGDRRWKIEHAQVVDPIDFDYFKNGIIPSVQPTHATSDMYWAHDRLGEERMTGAYAFKSLLDKAGLLALGTDFPVEKVNPFHTFYAAVARKDLEHFPPEGFRIQEALSREDALRGMTIWAAYSNFEENKKGSIETGKWADFVILDKDIIKIPEDEIPGVQVEKVYIAGRNVRP